MTKGWIALDIDGTITIDKYSVPEAVTAYLKGLEREGWKIAIATGRSFHYASLALSQFDFPYTLICQNGSVALEMPSQNILFKKYLSWDALGPLNEAYEGIDSDFLVYMGVEKKDLCYFRPHKFLEGSRPAVRAFQETQKESWQAVPEFTPDLGPSFAVAKGFGAVEQMKLVAERIHGRFQAPLIRNPFAPGAAIVLITDLSTSKGHALQEVFCKKGRGDLVIGAGDDENDISLLKVADIGIAMAHAPEVLQEHADILAPPTSNLGIIHALQMAIDGKKGN
jgi:hydroxymethylpyrimidine pyrophosphatase-like HAD family hydrolase